MSIELHRIERIKKKRKKRSRRFMIGMFIISILSVIVSALIAWSIYDGYKKTHKWDKQAITGTYAQMTPEFAKNHISADMIDDVNSLSNVTAILESVKSNNGLKDINQAKSALANSENILEKYQIISGEAYDKQEELRLYIDIYELEQTAYETLDSVKLSQIMTTLSSKLVEKNASHDKAIMNRLNQIATDYNTLNSFVNTYVPVLGTIDNGLVTVKSEVTQATTDEMINRINENNLEKFQNIKTLKELLQSSKWENIIKNNTTISNENKWKERYQVFDSLTKSLYVKESDVTTYADAMNLGLYVEGLVEKEGYEISKKSTVGSIIVEGVKVKSGQYFRKDAKVTVMIKPIYDKLPEPSSGSTSTTSSSSDDTETSTTTSISEESSSTTDSSTNSSSTYSDDSYSSPSTSSSSSTSTSISDDAE